MPVTASMLELLAALQDWPEVETGELRGRPEWDQALAWGWIMDSGELTGSGSRHLHDPPAGLVDE